MSDGKLIKIITTRTFIYEQVPPFVPGRFTVSFTSRGLIMTGHFAFDAPSLDTTVTSRPVSITLNGGAPTVFDGFHPFDFPVTAGDAVVVTPTGDVNSGGITGPPGTPLSITAAVAITPPAPGTFKVTFTEP